MTVLEAHEFLANIPAEERGEIFDGDFEVCGPRGSADCWPAFAVASAIVCGWLSSCDSFDELKDAVRQGERLLSAEIVDETAFEEEASAVIRQVCAYGQGVDSPLAAVAESN